METSVWMRLFAQAADFLSSLSGPSSSQGAQGNGTGSLSVPANDASSTSTSRSATGQGVLRVTRNPAMTTADALFGDMEYDGEWIAATMERTAVAIPLGTYNAYKRDSAHFGVRVVGIDVPNRANIEIHPANYPTQLEGCIAVGSTIDNDALDNSREAFDRMMSAVPERFIVQVQ